MANDPTAKTLAELGAADTSSVVRLFDEVREQFARNPSRLNKALGYTPGSDAQKQISRTLGPGYIVTGAIVLAGAVYGIIWNLVRWR